VSPSWTRLCYAARSGIVEAVAFGGRLAEVLERRGSFEGLVEIWIGDTKRLDAQVNLAKYVEVVEIRTTGGVQYMDGPESWDGYLVGVSEHDRGSLIGEQLDLKLANGQTGRAVMKDYNSGFLTGVREAPF